MASDSIIDTKLFIRLDLSNPSIINKRYFNNKDILGHLGSQLLLYNKIVIPTYDFGIVPILISWLGLDLFKDIIDSNTITFLRHRGLLGYIGNGNGINLFEIHPGENKPLHWAGEAMFGDIDKALELQIINTLSGITSKERNNFLVKVLEHSKEVKYDNDTFMKDVVEESYLDVLKSPRYSFYVFNSGEKRKEDFINLRWLSGVGPDQLRVLGNEGRIEDAVGLVLSIADINLQLLMSTQSDDADLFVPNRTDYLLTEKVRRVTQAESLLDGFISLLELTDIPDIRPAISNGDISFSKVWSIRNEGNAIKFREWLREANPKDSRELEKAYVALLDKDSLVNPIPGRLIRIGITTAAGLLPGIGGLIGGLTADVVDSIFVERWLEGYSPKLFFDEIRQLL